jgi:DNA-binding LacI/PurR family transcriptional regulator
VIEVNVTIKDVAKKANVATSTVSRVISGSERISKATQDRVKQAMEELGYYPNITAKNLVKKNVETVGIIMPRSAEDLFINPFFPEVIRGIQVYAQDNHYDLLMASGRDEVEEKHTVERIVYGKRVDGVILLCSRTSDRLIKQLDDQKIPFVVIGKPLTRPRVNWVDNDNIKASHEVTKHLIRMGHRRIGFISGSLDFVVSLDRLDGYKTALQDDDIPFSRELVIYGEFNRESGRRAFQELLSLEKRPTAIIAVDDVMALGLSLAAQELGFQIPNDLAIVGFNNTMLSEFSYPGITSVDIGIYDLGYNAAQILIEQIKNPELQPKQIIIPTRLIIRSSSNFRRSESK